MKEVIGKTPIDKLGCNVFYENDNIVAGEICPVCKGELKHSNIDCPDGRVGCYVMHFGYVCIKCQKQFEH